MKAILLIRNTLNSKSENMTRIGKTGLNARI